MVSKRYKAHGPLGLLRFKLGEHKNSGLFSALFTMSELILHGERMENCSRVNLRAWN